MIPDDPISGGAEEALPTPTPPVRLRTGLFSDPAIVTVSPVSISRITREPLPKSLAAVVPAMPCPKCGIPPGLVRRSYSGDGEAGGSWTEYRCGCGPINLRAFPDLQKIPGGSHARPPAPEWMRWMIPAILMMSIGMIAVLFVTLAMNAAP